MIKDIEFPELKNIHLAVIKSQEDESWTVFLINENDFPLENAMVVSKGYGQKEKQEVKTSTLRRRFKLIPAKSVQQIEPIQPDLLELNNEYWVSYFAQNKLFDKKFVFTSAAINIKFVVDIPLMDQKGILHA